MIAQQGGAKPNVNGCPCYRGINDLRRQISLCLPGPANLLVCEIFSSEFLGEGVLSSIEDAKRRLLNKDATVIPASGSVMCAVCAGESLRKNTMVEGVLGFDLSAFNEIVSEKRYVHRQDLEIELLTDAVEAFRFDFAGSDHFPADRRTLRIPITEEGDCFGIVQWIRLALTDEKIIH